MECVLSYFLVPLLLLYGVYHKTGIRGGSQLHDQQYERSGDLNCMTSKERSPWGESQSSFAHCQASRVFHLGDLQCLAYGPYSTHVHLTVYYIRRLQNCSLSYRRFQLIFHQDHNVHDVRIEINVSGRILLLFRDNLCGIRPIHLKQIQQISSRAARSTPLIVIVIISLSPQVNNDRSSGRGGK